MFLLSLDLEKRHLWLKVLLIYTLEIWKPNTADGLKCGQFSAIPALADSGVHTADPLLGSSSLFPAPLFLWTFQHLLADE